MSAAAPGSAEDKKDEPKPKPGGLLGLMSKENTVVSKTEKQNFDEKSRWSMDRQKW